MQDCLDSEAHIPIVVENRFHTSKEMDERVAWSKKSGVKVMSDLYSKRPGIFPIVLCAGIAHFSE